MNVFSSISLTVQANKKRKGRKDNKGEGKRREESHHMPYFISVLSGDKYYYFQIIYEIMALQVITCQGHTFAAESRVHPIGHQIQSGPVLFLYQNLSSNVFMVICPSRPWTHCLEQELWQICDLISAFPVQYMAQARKRFAKGRNEERMKEKRKEARDKRVIWWRRKWQEGIS